MSFFDRDEPLRDESPGGPPPGRPRWAGPPADELGVHLGHELAVIRSRDAVLQATAVRVFSTGLSVALSVRGREQLPLPRLLSAFRGPQPGQLEIGVDMGVQGEAALGDLEQALRRPTSLTHEPDGPLVLPGGGGGGDRSYELSVWIWPLPVETIELVLRWADVGIEESRVRLDGEAVRRAAAESTPLW